VHLNDGRLAPAEHQRHGPAPDETERTTIRAQTLLIALLLQLLELGLAASDR